MKTFKFNIGDEVQFKPDKTKMTTAGRNSSNEEIDLTGRAFTVMQQGENEYKEDVHGKYNISNKFYHLESSSKDEPKWHIVMVSEDNIEAVESKQTS